MTGALLADIAFETVLVAWRGPAPFVFAPVPDTHWGAVRFAAHEASYGWGMVPVAACIGTTDFATSLFPREGGYLLPVKVAVQSREAIGPGDRVQARITIFGR